MKTLTVRKVKFIASFLLMLVTFYPAFELSRCIIVYNIIGGWRPGWQGVCIADFYAELAFIWAGYILIPFIMNWVINLIVKITANIHITDFDKAA